MKSMMTQIRKFRTLGSARITVMNNTCNGQLHIHYIKTDIELKIIQYYISTKIETHAVAVCHVAKKADALQRYVNIEMYTCMLRGSYIKWHHLYSITIHQVGQITYQNCFSHFQEKIIFLSSNRFTGCNIFFHTLQIITINSNVYLDCLDL